MLKIGSMRGKRVALLATLVMAGGTLFTSCSLTDVRYNVVAGALSFVKSYTGDWLGALAPDPDDVLSGGDAGA